MRKSVIAILLFAIVGLSRTASAAGGPDYYLALGDSLAIGLQRVNGASVPTNRGYADDLYALARLKTPGLRLTKLGCSGETTTTMITGGVCSYPAGSQLAQAVAFLQTHRVSFITIDLGANNLFPCVSLIGGLDAACAQTAINTVLADMTQILLVLRTAAPGVPIVGMNYYDPFLALWVQGAQGQALATLSCTATLAFNDVLEYIYGTFHVPVANVEAAFHTGDCTPVSPLGVLTALTWTYMGAPPPNGPDVHPNSLGYAAIAGAFVKAFQAAP